MLEFALTETSINICPAFKLSFVNIRRHAILSDFWCLWCYLVYLPSNNGISKRWDQGYNMSMLPSKAMKERNILVIYWSAQGKPSLWGNVFYQDHPPWPIQLKQGLLNEECIYCLTVMLLFSDSYVTVPTHNVSWMQW